MQFVEPLIGGAAAFFLGFLWYTFGFGKLWQRETGLSDERIQSGNMLLIHGGAFLMMVILSIPINFIIGMHELPEQTFTHGGFHGMMVGLLVAVPAIAIMYLYQRKSFKLFLIDGGYLTAMLALSGAVMALLKLG